MRYTSPEGYTSIAFGQVSFAADDAGVFDIPAEHAETFRPMLAAGVLVPAVEITAGPDLAALANAVDVADAKVAGIQSRIDTAKTQATKDRLAAILVTALDESSAAHAAYDNATADVE